MEKKHFAELPEKLGIKPFIILVIVLLFLIPIQLINSIIKDRISYHEDAVTSILQPKGGEPVIKGFVVVLPFTKTVEKADKDGKVFFEKSTDYIIATPEDWNLETSVKPEYLRRGIFEVPVFTCTAYSIGNFASAEYVHYKLKSSDILWDEALFLVGISNKKNLTKLPTVVVDSQSLEISPIKIEKSSPFTNTVFYSLPKNYAQNGFKFSVETSLQGGNKLSITPNAANNHFSVTSTWATPGFAGGWLPSERMVSSNGFSAKWEITGFSTVFPKTWITGEADTSLLKTENIQINFITPVDSYQKTTRSVKYAILFLIIPFIAIFIFEVFTKLKIHPVQYCLIGLADIIFYLLLLSISERLPFTLTYWISSAAVCVLMLFYTATIFKKIKYGLLFSVVQMTLYVFMFGTIQAEDYALLVGSLGLFCVVGLLMFLTRKIDWYSGDIQK